MKRALAAIGLLLLPTLCAAHATPVDYVPAADAVLADAPEEVSIRFTERVERQASRVEVFGPDGAPLPIRELGVGTEDPRLFRAAFSATASGTYTVSWRAVSADDGHLTTGAYGFSVGAPTSTAPTGSFRVVHRSDTVDAIATWLELLGTALLIGILLLIGLVRAGRADAEWGSGRERRFLRRARALAIVAGLLSAVGALWFAQRYAAVLENDLAGLVRTASGSHALFRAIAALAAGPLIAALAGRIADKRTWQSALCWLPIVLIALSRARMSHAAASELLPAFSILVNAVHLVSKDLWIGALLAGLVLLPPLIGGPNNARRLSVALRGVTRIAAWSLLVGGWTGTYVVWLHLKSFPAALTTLWGRRFVALNAFAAFLLALRLRQAFVGDRAAERGDAESAGAAWVWFVTEALTGAGVLLVTALLILTTPPVLPPDTYVRQAASQGALLTLRQPAEEPAVLLLELEDGQGAMIDPTALTVTLANDAADVGPIVAAPVRRFAGGFALPASALTPPGAWTIDVSASRPGAYDATARFPLSAPEDLVPRPAGRSLALTLACLAALAGITALWWLLRRNGVGSASSAGASIAIEGVTGWGTLRLAVFNTLLLFILGLGLGHAEAPVAALCERLGGMWHESAPMREGRVLSPLALPGCMIGMGAGTSHLVDARELEEFTRRRTTVASVADNVLPAGETGAVVVRVTDLSGALVTGLVPEHDRYLHAIAVGRDLRAFLHAHPADRGPVFTVPMRLPLAGKYALGLDWTVRGSPQAQVLTLTATGSGPAMTAVDDAVTPLTQEVDGYAVSLKLPWHGLKTGKEQAIRFTLRKDGAPARDLRPYLAAPMHIAVVSADTRRFLHAHGELPRFWIDAIFHPRVPDVAHAHGSLPDGFGPDIDAYLTFPEPGRYAIFAEFRDDFGVHRARFVVEVGE